MVSGLRRKSDFGMSTAKKWHRETGAIAERRCFTGKELQAPAELSDQGSCMHRE